MANSTPEGMQFRELLTMFNLITEKCFHRCVESMHGRECTDSESKCIEECTSKYSNFSAKLVPHFVTQYDKLINKRVKEMEKANEEALASSNAAVKQPSES